MEYTRQYMSARVDEASSLTGRARRRWLRNHFFRVVGTEGGRDGDAYLAERGGRDRIRAT